MLDTDLARLYDVETRALLQAVKRNIERFPGDFMFQLTQKEFDSLRSQSVISNPERRGGRRYLPYAFTEQGVARFAAFRSDRAIHTTSKSCAPLCGCARCLPPIRAGPEACSVEKYDTHSIVFNAPRVEDTVRAEEQAANRLSRGEEK
jgi:hypothetical protein